MKELADYYRAADALVQGSLEEGLGLSPLEALACEVPTVVTAVGGMAAHLGEYALLTPRRDAVAMAAALLQIAANPGAARARARRGREYVCRCWSRDRAFRELQQVLEAAAGTAMLPPRRRRDAHERPAGGSRSGFYARKQMFNRARLIAWTHNSRFAMAVSLAKQLGGAASSTTAAAMARFSGCSLASGQRRALPSARSSPPTSSATAASGSAGTPGLHFTLIADLQDAAAQQGAYDAIYCMEVLEHVVDPAPLLDQFNRLLAPGGALVISVPIETGLPVVVKQVARRIAGWRGIGHYPGTTGYTPLETGAERVRRSDGSTCRGPSSRGPTGHVPRPQGVQLADVACAAPAAVPPRA